MLETTHINHKVRKEKDFGEAAVITPACPGGPSPKAYTVDYFLN